LEEEISVTWRGYYLEEEGLDKRKLEMSSFLFCMGFIPITKMGLKIWIGYDFSAERPGLLEYHKPRRYGRIGLAW